MQANPMLLLLSAYLKAHAPCGFSELDWQELPDGNFSLSFDCYEAYVVYVPLEEVFFVYSGSETEDYDDDALDFEVDEFNAAAHALALLNVAEDKMHDIETVLELAH